MNHVSGSLVGRRFICTAGLTAVAIGLASRASASPPPSPPSPPTDINGRKVEASGGGALPDDWRDRDPATGGQKAYVVLTPEERAKGFVRPVRDTYTHLKCGYSTTMSRDIAETLAADPKFYSSCFCVHCRAAFPFSEFVWYGTQETVGS